MLSNDTLEKTIKYLDLFKTDAAEWFEKTIAVKNNYVFLRTQNANGWFPNVHPAAGLTRNQLLRNLRCRTRIWLCPMCLEERNSHRSTHRWKLVVVRWDLEFCKSESALKRNVEFSSEPVS